jgi:hypothetical protein
MASEDERDLAPVVEVVLDEVPDDPAARDLGAGAAWSRELPGEVIGGSTPKARIDHRPGPAEGLGKLA